MYCRVSPNTRTGCLRSLPSPRQHRPLHRDEWIARLDHLLFHFDKLSAAHGWTVRSKRWRNQEILLHRRDDGCDERWNGITIPAHRPPRLNLSSYKSIWHINIPTTLPPLRRGADDSQLSHPWHGLYLHRSTQIGRWHGRGHGLQGAVLFGWVGEIRSA